MFVVCFQHSICVLLFVAVYRLSVGNVLSTFLVRSISKCTARILYDLWPVALLL